MVRPNELRVMFVKREEELGFCHEFTIIQNGCFVVTSSVYTVGDDSVVHKQTIDTTNHPTLDSAESAVKGLIDFHINKGYKEIRFDEGGAA